MFAEILFLFAQLDAAAGIAPADPVKSLDDAPIFFATATVQERALDSATASVTVLGSEVLERSGAASTFEVLPFVPGVSLLSGGTRGGLTLALIRGGDPNYTSVLVDGIRVNDGTDQLGGVFNLEALPLDAVERVEVVRGPTSSIYGSTGLSGAIQVITRRGEGPRRLGGQLTTGNANLYRAGAHLAAGGVARDIFLHLLAEGEEERIAGESFDLLHFQGRLRRNLGANRSLHLHGRFASWTGEDYPDASGGPVFGDGELRKSDHEDLSLGARWASNSHSRRLHRFDAAFSQRLMDRSSPAVAPLVPSAVEDTRTTRGRLGWASTWGNSLGALSLGAEIEREEAENQSLLFLPPIFGGAVVGDYSTARTLGGAYGEWSRNSGRLSWDFGLRVDLPADQDVELSPRLGLAYSLGQGGTRLVASLGRAFKLPSFFALSSPTALGGNPDLKPEVMVGGDLGIEGRFAQGSGRFGVKFFVQEFEDLVDFDFETFSNVNRAEVESQGVELDVSWRPTSTWTVASNLTWQEVEDATTDLPLRHRPQWAGAVRLAWRVAQDLDLHADLRFSSSRVDAQLPVPDRDRAGGYQLLGCAATWQASPQWRLTLRFDNLGGEEYETLIGFPGAGRSGRLTLGWNPRRAGRSEVLRR